MIGIPWFYVDDGFSDSKPVESLPDHLVKAPLRLAVCGLWVLAGSWSAKEETDGLVPVSKLRQLGGTPTIIRGLTDPGRLNAPLCEIENRPTSGPKLDPVLPRTGAKFGPNSDPIRFRNWPKWQKTKAELQARREAEAEKKRQQRAAQKTKGRNAVSCNDEEPSIGDVPVDTDGEPGPAKPDSANTVPGGLPRDPRGRARRPDPTLPKETYSPNEESSLDVARERALSEPVTVSASRLVAVLIPDTYPGAVRTALRLQASQLITADRLDPDVVADALRRWLTKPGAGPGLLPSLAADVIRERSLPTNNGIGKPTQKALGYRQRGAELINELHGKQP